MEKLKCAAVKYRLLGEEKFQYATGPDHSSCHSWLHCVGIYRHLRDEYAEREGFLTTEGRFVDRAEAIPIAKAADQIPQNFNQSLLNSYQIKW